MACSEFSNERERVEKRNAYIKLRHSSRLRRTSRGIVDWITTAGARALPFSNTNKFHSPTHKCYSLQLKYLGNCLLSYGSRLSVGVMLCTSEEAILNEERSTEEEKMRILEGTLSFNHKAILVARAEKKDKKYGGNRYKVDALIID